MHKSIEETSSLILVRRLLISRLPISIKINNTDAQGNGNTYQNYKGGFIQCKEACINSSQTLPPSMINHLLAGKQDKRGNLTHNKIDTAILQLGG